jgi:iron-sulfur cluster repair protein YtfE (RIC family)
MPTNYFFHSKQLNPDSLCLYQSERDHAETRIVLNLLGKTMEHIATGKEVPQFLPEVYDRFLTLADTIENNQRKEETIFFPFVAKMIFILQGNKSVDFPMQTMVKNPINFMRKEHDRALSMVNEIRKLTNNYSLKQVESFEGKLCLSELFALHQHLEKHYYLEENILFEQVFFLENSFNQINPVFFR